jgi:beta-barrel assembly-enhancing protease
MMNSGGLKLRLIIGVVMALVAVFSYYGKTQVNPLTGENQQVGMSPQEEVAMGLQSAPTMAQEYGGLYQDQQVQTAVKNIGNKLVQGFQKEIAQKDMQVPYTFDFHVLQDPQTVNAFALPGGQIFITVGLLKRLKSEDQIAGVLGHEIGHVVHRHSAQQMAQTEFYQGLAGAATAAAGDYGTAQIANYVAQVRLMKFGRNDELQSDEFGVKTMVNSNFDPNALIDVMHVLAESSGGGEDRSEFMSTHPSPANRIQKIKEHIAKYSHQ